MKKKSLLNIFSDLGSKVLLLVIGIILPKLYIENFGSEINGLLSSISSILMYVDLLEAGVGAASTQALYGSIANNKLSDVNSTLAATNGFYKRTGLYFLGIVSTLAFLYPYCVKSSIPYGTVSVLILLSAVPAAIKYLFQGKYTVLLSADNRSYILSIITTIITILTNVSKVVLVLLGYNVVVIQCVFALISFLQMILIYVYVKRHYKWLDLNVVPNKKALSKSKYIMIHNIADLILRNVDVLVLTLFGDLKIVSIYSVYHLIYAKILGITRAPASGVTASFGQMYTIDREKFKTYYQKFVIAYRFWGGVIFLSVAICTLPFIRLYAKDFSDANYVDVWLPLLFFMSNYLDVMRLPELYISNVTGFFKETSKHAIIECAINVFFSFALGWIWEIYGVLIATIIALGYRCIVFYVFIGKRIMERNYKKDIVYLLVSLAVAILVIFYFTQVLTIRFATYFELFGFAITTGIISLVVFGILIFLFYGKNIIRFMKERIESR